MSYPTCDTCKHYGDYNADGQYESDKPAFEGYPTCLNPKLGINGTLTSKDAGCDCHAYHDHQTGQLSPGPKFGCIHHEPK